MASETFIDYDIYIDKLLQYMNENNGKHSINKEKASQWINAQPIKEVKNVARKLIDITVYVSFSDIHKYIEKLTTTYYKKIQDDPNNVIHMFIGAKDKSNYFLSILGLYYIKKHKYREPTMYFIDNPYSIITSKSDTDKSNYKLIYFDDKTYSGGQIIMFLNKIMLNIYNNVCIPVVNSNLDININTISNPEEYTLINKILQTKSITFINNFKQILYTTIKNYKYYDIVFLLLGINKIALDRIMSYNFYLIFNIYKNYININDTDEIPFKILYNFYYSKNYNTLDYYFTEEELFYLGYFFSLGRLPPVSIYYDHKIGDPASTFNKLLNYGPVVPVNYDIAHYWNNFKYVLNKYTIKQITTNYLIMPYTKQFFTLCYKYYKKIATNKYQNIKLPIKLIPFINNCNNVQYIIENPLLQHINYCMFIIIDGLCTYKFDYKSIPNNPMFTSINLLDKYINNLELKKTLKKFLNSIYVQRCNLVFYKIMFNIKKSKKYTNNSHKSQSRKSQSHKSQSHKSQSHKSQSHKSHTNIYI